VWDDLRKAWAVERELLSRLEEVYRPLLGELVGGKQPTGIQTAALATVLHSFYNGVENTFKRIALGTDGRLPRGGAWHRELLDSMASRTPTRATVISQSLHDRLEEYLRFRHRFRHAYSFQLDWEEMCPLARALDETLSSFETQVGAFLEGASDRSG